MTEHADQPMHHQQVEHQLLLVELRLSRAQQALASSQHRLRRGALAHEATEEVEEESWQTTYLDMLTLMLVMLVVMLAFAGKGSSDSAPVNAPAHPAARQSMIPLPTRIPEAVSVDAQPKPDIQEPAMDPLADLNTGGLGKDIEVIVNQQSVSFRISSEIIFPPAQADLSLEGLSLLQQLLPVLQSGNHLITVAGHTDNLPIRSLRYPSNWELSGARAGSVVRYLEANGISSARMSAVGHADTRPIADNANPQTRASNRRVELILERPKP